MAFGTIALAGPLTWQTTPILGTDYLYTGDVIMNTGSIPITIPHYSMVGDPLFGVGDPSMTVFGLGQSVATGSGVYTDTGTYDIYGVFRQLTGGTRTTTYHDVYQGDAGNDGGFILEVFSEFGALGEAPESGLPLNAFTEADLGLWSYTETWTNQADRLDTITATNPFEVATPEPGTMLLLGAALLGLAACRYSRKLS
jgi:hypothetical protein